MRRLTRLTVEGYKSIKNQTLELEPLNVLIGGNGVGKSNLISVFKFLRIVFEGGLNTKVGASGGADKIMYFGRKNTGLVRLQLTFENADHPEIKNIYRLVLSPTDEDNFVISDESAAIHNTAKYSSPAWVKLGSGHTEAKISTSTGDVVEYVKADLASYRVYHFHDTSDSAPPKQTCNLDDNRFLKDDGSNLASFLYWMKLKYKDDYSLIEDTVKRIAPYFDCFQLHPSRLNEEKIRLEWKELGSDTYFNAHQLSDGTLRFICMATLLLQPNLPGMVLLDEPELGLHPAAINLLAELLKLASEKTQLLVATQSVTLINQLEPQHIWVADRKDGATVFNHLDINNLKQWVGDYGLGELWEKNVIGGRP